MESTIHESCLNGESTGEESNVVALPGIGNVSTSYVSGIASNLVSVVKEFIERQIESPMKLIYIDATYFRIRGALKV